jgi:hypothetical protein
MTEYMSSSDWIQPITTLLPSKMLDADLPNEAAKHDFWRRPEMRIQRNGLRSDHFAIPGHGGNFIDTANIYTKGQYCAYVETRANEYGNPLSDPHARDYAIRDFKSHLKKERKAKPASVHPMLAALDHLSFGNRRIQPDSILHFVGLRSRAREAATGQS